MGKKKDRGATSNTATTVKKDKKRKLDEKPSLYIRDVGTKGLKPPRKTGAPTAVGVGTLPLTKDELQRRKDRLANRSNQRQNNHNNNKQTNLINTSETLIGTNQNLEKPYLRLTTFPRKEDVRPLSVLQRALEHIKMRYKAQEDFPWANEQLKSVRQDITVQGIRNNFVLEVYETHARILLEHGDLNEFNQCQTMLRSLTEGTFLDDSIVGGGGGGGTGSHTKKKRKKKHCKPLKQAEKCADEFGAYALLYALVNRSAMSLKMELMRVRRFIRTPVHQTRSPCSNGVSGTACQHAVTVVQAVSDNNYHQFFTMYNTAPHLSAYLMDFLLKRIREAAYKSIVSAFRPSVSLPDIHTWLGFLDEQEAVSFLNEQGAAIFIADDSTNNSSSRTRQEGDALQIDCKSSMDAAA